MKKRSIFRYIPKERVQRFLAGEVYCNSLKYFQQIEDEDVRGDSKEAISILKPKSGLQINNLTTTNSFMLKGWQFESAANANEIYVYCMSQNMSDRLATEFEATACVELLDVEKFCSMVERNLPAGFIVPSINSRTRVGHRVRYYDVADPPGNLWALPELIAISKRKHYDWQAEFRLVFGKSGVFDVEKVKLQLTNVQQDGQVSTETSEPIVLQIGDISDICRVRYFE